MLRKYAHPTCRRKEYRDGESLSSDTIPSDPGGSTPNAMKVAYWNRVDRKLAFPRPQKNEVYSNIQSLRTHADCRICGSIERGSYRIGLGHSQGLESDCSSE